MVRGPAAILTILVINSVPQTCFRSIPCTAVSPVQNDDEYEAHAAFLVESEGFGVLDCGATTSFGGLEGAEALFSKSHEHDTRFPEVDPFGVDHSTLEMVLHQRLLPCPDSQSEMMLLVTSGSLCICSWISRNRLL